MPGSHERYEELLPAFALGALDDAELREVERHLEEGCPSCERLLLEWAATADSLAAEVTPVVPSEATRARILAAVQAPGGDRRDRGRGVAWLAAAAASAALLLGGWLALRQQRLDVGVEQLASDRRRTVERVAGLERRLGAAMEQVVRLAESVRLIGSPTTRTVALAGLGPAPGAAGTTLVRPAARRALFFAFDLPPPAPGKTYQLWYIGEGGPVSAGTFEIDRAGDAVVEVDGLPAPETIAAWAVTVEPAGGVPQPTGEMVLKG